MAEVSAWAARDLVLSFTVVVPWPRQTRVWGCCNRDARRGCSNRRPGPRLPLDFDTAALLPVLRIGDWSEDVYPLEVFGTRTVDPPLWARPRATHRLTGGRVDPSTGERTCGLSGGSRSAAYRVSDYS